MLQTTPLSDILSETKKVEWLIDGILPKSSLMLVYGPTGIGKTFFLLDLALTLAAGMKWPRLPADDGKEADRKKHPVPVLYWIGEGELSARARVKSWMKHNFPDREVEAASDISFSFLGSRNPNMLLEPNARDPRDRGDASPRVAALIETLSSMEHIGKHSDNAPPPLFIVDTLSATHPGMEENDARATGALIENCRTIIEKTGGAVILVHHSGKNRGGGPRGHSRLTGDPDVIMHLMRVSKQDNILKAVMEKQRMARPKGHMFFEMVSGQDNAPPILRFIPRLPDGAEKNSAKAITPGYAYLKKGPESTFKVAKALQELIDRNPGRSITRLELINRLKSTMGEKSVYAKVTELKKAKILKEDQIKGLTVVPSSSELRERVAQHYNQSPKADDQKPEAVGDHIAGSDVASRDIAGATHPNTGQS